MASPPIRPDARPLPKRFYTEATTEAVRTGDGGVGFRILLDGRPLRTPAKAELQLPTQALAEAVAAEWRAQASHIEPATMPLTRLANSTIDGVAVRRDEVVAEIARYAMNDLVYYRADQPEALVRRQAEAWDGVIDWAQRAFGVTLATGQGIAHVAQPPALASAVTAALAPRATIEVSAIHVITTLTGSALLALALAQGAMEAPQIWAAAHVDEDFQISQWGWDAEAEARRKAREADFSASAHIFGLME